MLNATSMFNGVNPKRHGFYLLEYAAPSVSPTVEPTALPSADPSAEPTLRPTPGSRLTS